jgi:hypothetical protein
MFVVVLTLQSNFRQCDFMKARAITVDARRDSHLEKVPGFVEFHLLGGPRLRITPCMLLTPCGKTVLYLKRGQNQRRSGQHIVGQGTTSRFIRIIRSSRGLRCARRWDAARPPEGLGQNPVNACLRGDRRGMTYARKANPRRFWPTGANACG